MRPATAQTYQERILRVLVHIQEHLDEALCLEELAAVASFSPCHFARIFQGMVGEPLMTHIRRLRLERAALRLKHAAHPVTRIAFEAGYETHEAFTRAFHALFGCSPTQFREQQAVETWPPSPSNIHYDPTGGGPREFTPHHSGGIRMDACLKQMDALRVAFVRHIGPYHEVGPTWEKLCKWAGRRWLFGRKTVLLGLCHDDPQVTPPERIRYDACIVVSEKVQAEGEVGIQVIPAGEYAMTVHHGPYSDLAQTYAQLCGEWIPQQGHELRSAPSLEIYQNDPNKTPPEKLLTEVYVPVE